MTPNVDNVSEHYPPSMGDGSNWSPPGSIKHPYRSLMQNTIFPRCHQLAFSYKGPETYIRSLSMLGQGVALWDPLGSVTSLRKRKHLKTGINIGDVGYLNPAEGDFEYYFNIFCSPTDEVQAHCPPDFEPLSPPIEEHLVKNDAYFSPGTALVSKGVSVVHHATSPVDVEFTINARESGILLLPQGASREDLISTELVRQFVHKNALAWYMFINKFSDPLCPNGTLYVVTGCDKTASYALATSSTTSLYEHDHAPNIRYHDGGWDGHEYYRVEAMTSDVSSFPDPCAVIIRGMQVALSPADWINYIFRNEPSMRPSFYYMLNVPVTGHRAWWYTKKEKILGTLEKRSNGDSRCVIFNPSIVILQYLLNQAPRSQVAIAEDRHWCSQTNQSDGTVQELVRIVRNVLEAHTISEENGLATLVPLPSNLEPPPSRSQNFILRGLTLLHERFKVKRRRRSIAKKLAKVFPGQGLPRELISV